MHPSSLRTVQNTVSILQALPRGAMVRVVGAPRGDTLSPPFLFAHWHLRLSWTSIVEIMLRHAQSPAQKENNKPWDSWWPEERRRRRGRIEHAPSTRHRHARRRLELPGETIPGMCHVDGMLVRTGGTRSFASASTAVLTSTSTFDFEDRTGDGDYRRRQRSHGNRKSAPRFRPGTGWTVPATSCSWTTRCS
jgi:hypothetical protein